MKYRTRTYYTDSQKALMWERWKQALAETRAGAVADLSPFLGVDGPRPPLSALPRSNGFEPADHSSRLNAQLSFSFVMDFWHRSSGCARGLPRQARSLGASM